MSVQCDAKHKLANAVETLTVANNAFRDLIRVRRDKNDRLEQFKTEFRQVEDRFTQFETMALIHEKQAEKLQVQLTDELNRYQTKAKNLKTDIVQLKGIIEKQSVENEELEFNLKQNVEKLQKLKYQSDNQNGTYANALPPTKSDPNIFIQRLPV